MKTIEINSPTYGKKQVFVDDEDYDFLSQWKWQLKCHRNTFYAHRTQSIKGTKSKLHYKMHRVIMNVSDPKIQIDHKDRNGLNCTKENLRIATHYQNQQNRGSEKNSTSKFVGVSKITRIKRDGIYNAWLMYISVNKKEIRITKTYPFTKEGEIMAAKHYDELAKKHRGEFANLNFKQI